LAVLLGIWGASPASGAILDRVVVVVERELVLESDIRLEAVLSGLDTQALPFWHQRQPDPEERLVEAAIVRHLAADVSLYQPSPGDVVHRVEAIRAHFPDRDAWTTFLTQWGLTEESLRVVVRRRMVVERYLTRNITTEPDKRQAWTRDVEALIRSVRPRLRIRSVELRGEASDSP